MLKWDKNTIHTSKICSLLRIGQLKHALGLKLCGPRKYPYLAMEGHSKFQGEGANIIILKLNWNFQMGGCIESVTILNRQEFSPPQPVVTYDVYFPGTDNKKKKKHIQFHASKFILKMI